MMKYGLPPMVSRNGFRQTTTNPTPANRDTLRAIRESLRGCEWSLATSLAKGALSPLSDSLIAMLELHTEVTIADWC